MRIKKISPTTPANGNIENQYGTSQTNAYSEEYSNNTFASKNIENYSTTETRIGTWIDGKPLYRKVLTGTKVIGSVLVFTVSNIETIVDVSGIIKVQDNYINPLPFYENADVFGRIQCVGDNISVITSSNAYANGPTMIIAKYTKTTD